MLSNMQLILIFYKMNKIKIRNMRYLTLYNMIVYLQMYIWCIIIILLDLYDKFIAVTDLLMLYCYYFELDSGFHFKASLKNTILIAYITANRKAAHLQ